MESLPKPLSKEVLLQNLKILNSPGTDRNIPPAMLYTNNQTYSVLGNNHIRAEALDEFSSNPVRYQSAINVGTL